MPDSILVNKELYYMKAKPVAKLDNVFFVFFPILSHVQ
jgi:hypothetical protein